METIPVYTLKNEEAGRRKNKNSHFRGRFRGLVMKVIRSRRLSNPKSVEQDLLQITNLSNVNI
jgi:hypothetical protein